MTFMGDILLSDELQLSEVRLKAITKVPALKHQFEGRRFLCSVQFCATFIPQLALISALSGVCPPKMPDGNSAPKKQYQRYHLYKKILVTLNLSEKSLQ